MLKPEFNMSYFARFNGSQLINIFKITSLFVWQFIVTL